MKTLHDCIAVYEEQQTERAEEAKAEEVKKRIEQGEQTLEAFLKMGLQPQRVEGTKAVFEFEGKEIVLLVNKWKYGNFGFYRVLDDVCPACEWHFVTDEYELRPENIGWAISDPQMRFHDCQNWNVVKSSFEPKTKTSREVFMDALDAYIHTFVQEPI